MDAGCIKPIDASEMACANGVGERVSMDSKKANKRAADTLRRGSFSLPLLHISEDQYMESSKMSMCPYSKAM